MKLKKIKIDYMKGKKGQLPAAIAFAGIILVLILLAPILLKTVLTPLNKFSSALGTVDSTNKSSSAVGYITNTFTSMFDWIIMFIFIFSIVTLIFSSFFIDTHPAFLVIYIIGLAFLMIFTPNIMESIDKLWRQAQFANPANTDGTGANLATLLPMLSWLKDNYMFVILGVLILNGIIMFGKYKFAGGMGASTGDYR